MKTVFRLYMTARGGQLIRQIGRDFKTKVDAFEAAEREVGLITVVKQTERNSVVVRRFNNRNDNPAPRKYKAPTDAELARMTPDEFKRAQVEAFYAALSRKPKGKPMATRKRKQNPARKSAAEWHIFMNGRDTGPITLPVAQSRDLVKAYRETGIDAHMVNVNAPVNLDALNRQPRSKRKRKGKADPSFEFAPAAPMLTDADSDDVKISYQVLDGRTLAFIAKFASEAEAKRYAQDYADKHRKQVAILKFIVSASDPNSHAGQWIA